MKDNAFLRAAVDKYGEKVAVGVDLADGFVAIKGWTERTGLRAEDFFRELQKIGVGTVICTDISRDGAMRGTNRELYRRLSGLVNINIIASGGVSDIDDVRALRDAGLYGAIIGKAYYTGAIDLAEAVREAAAPAVCQGDRLVSSAPAACPGDRLASSAPAACPGDRLVSSAPAACPGDRLAGAAPDAITRNPDTLKEATE